MTPRQGFIGKELDSESDFANHGVRKYDYSNGKFMTVDPLWEMYRGLNTYQYAANNPIVLLDKKTGNTQKSKSQRKVTANIVRGWYL